MEVKAYAKINLSLAVTGVREDGYHTLRTVMQTVSLCDVLSMERAEGLTFTCDSFALAGEDNLCVKAAKAFFGVARVRGGAKIDLRKKIPTGAGLGGGSADAAAVLKTLNELYGRPLTTAQLLRLGATLGADVPFCLHGGKCICTGIGEILEPVSGGEKLELVIAKGANGLSTPDMYRRLDERRELRSAPDREGYFNDFEPIAEELLADVGILKRKLKELGAHHAMMTGSGSAVFGIFDSSARSEFAAGALRTAGWFAEPCTTV